MSCFYVYGVRKTSDVDGSFRRPTPQVFGFEDDRGPVLTTSGERDTKVSLSPRILSFHYYLRSLTSLLGDGSVRVLPIGK